MPGFERFPDDRAVVLPAVISHAGSEVACLANIAAHSLPEGLFEFSAGDLRALAEGLDPEDTVRLQIPQDLITANRPRQESLSFLSGAVVINPERQEVTLGSERPELSRKEFSVLHFLSFNAGRLMQRSTIYEAVWGDNVQRGKTLDVHVKRIRDKFGDYSWLIRSIRSGHGFDDGGYMFDDTPPQE